MSRIYKTRMLAAGTLTLVVGLAAGLALHAATARKAETLLELGDLRLAASWSESTLCNGVPVQKTTWARRPVTISSDRLVAVDLTVTCEVPDPLSIRGWRLYYVVDGVVTLADEATETNGRVGVSATVATVASRIPLGALARKKRTGFFVELESDLGQRIRTSSYGDVTEGP